MLRVGLILEPAQYGLLIGVDFPVLDHLTRHFLHLMPDQLDVVQG